MTVRRVAAALCVTAAVVASIAAIVTQPPATSPTAAREADSFEAWMAAPFPVADGFDPAVGTDGAVRAIGAGRVVDIATGDASWGTVVVIEHLLYENHQRRTVRSVSARLAGLDVRAGDVVTRGQRIGRVGADRDGSPRLHLDVRRDRVTASTYQPRPDRDSDATGAFIAARRVLPVPQAERRVLLIDSSRGRARLYENGARAGEWSAGLGQIAGCKEERDDGRSPCGMYFVTARHTGPFTGPSADYFGGYFLPLNYPNPWDAERGLAAGLITTDERDRIAAAWSARQATPRGTRLGDGIGVHGWIEDWTGDAGPRGSLGCAFFRADDIALLHELLLPGTMVVLW